MKKIMDYLEHWKEHSPEQCALCFLNYDSSEVTQNCIDWKTLYNMAHKYASYFQQEGVKKDSRIVITANQTPETIYSIFATLLLGGIFVLSPPPTDDVKIERTLSILEASGAEHIFIQHNSIVKTISEKISKKITILEPLKNNSLEAISCHSISNQEIISPIRTEINESDIALLQYTSGSTNKPKGVILTHKNIMAGMKVQNELVHCTNKDIYVTWLPFFHTMELTCGILYSLYAGRTHIVIQTNDFLSNPMCWIESLSEYKATITIAPMSGYLTSVNMFTANRSLYDSLDLSSIRYMISSSEPTHKQQADIVCNAFATLGLNQNNFCSGLGMTEALTMFTLTQNGIPSLSVDAKAYRNHKIRETSNPLEEQIILTGTGTPATNITVKVIHPTKLVECKPDEIGEIWYRGDIISMGYWNMKKETKAIFHAHYHGCEESFFRSGDMGFIKDNELYLTGRYKDCIIINGKNIFLADIEQTIRKFVPQLKQYTLKATSLSIEGTDQLLIAFEHAQDQTDYNELARTVNHIIARFFHISAYDIVITKIDGLPKTDNGKISPSRFKKHYKANTLETLFTLKKSTHENKNTEEFSEIGKKIKTIFEELLHVECRSTKDDYYSLGGTSLDIVQLIKQINKEFNVKLLLDIVLESATIGELEEHVRNALK